MKKLPSFFAARTFPFLNSIFHKRFPASSAGIQLAADELHHPEDAQALKGLQHVNHTIVHRYETFTAAIDEKAVADGVQGKPAADSHASHIETEIHTKHHAAATELQHHCQTAKTHLEHLLVRHYHELENHHSKEACLQKLESDKQAALAHADQHMQLPSGHGLRSLRKHMHGIKGMISALHAHVRHLTEQKNHADAHHHHLLVEHYHHVAPLKGFWDYPAVFWSIVGVFILVEAFINFTAFQSAGLVDTNLAALMVGIFFAIPQALSAKALGFAWHQQHKVKIGFYLIGTLVFCLLISGFRLWMEVSPMVKIFYLAVNFILAGITAIIAHKHARHHEYFFVQQKRHKLAEQIEHTERQIEMVADAHRKHCEAIERAFDKRAEALAEAEGAGLHKKIAQIESHLRQIETHKHQCLQQLDTLKHDALSTYRHLNQEARSLNGHPPVARWHNASPHSGHGVESAGANIAAMILALVLACFGCANPSTDIAPTHIEVLYDRTDTTHIQDTGLMADFIMGLALPGKQHEKWGEVTVTLSPIGEVSTQHIQVIHLPASESYWLRNLEEHRQRPEKFHQELIHALENLTQPGHGTEYSYIHRNMHNRLSALSRQHGKRILVSWCDLIVNDPKVNFYDYRQHPEHIGKHRDMLIEKMTEGYPLPDLSGVTLINIHEPTRKNDELHEHCKRFFHHYWTSHGLKVEFLTNITNHQYLTGAPETSE